MIVYRDISPNVSESFNLERHRERMNALRLVGDRFGCTLSGGALRENTGSLHDRQRGGLAGDLGAGTGKEADRAEQRVCAFAAQATYRDKFGRTRHLFQEVLWHGPPNHAHLAFSPNVNRVIRKVEKALRRYLR